MSGNSRNYENWLEFRKQECSNFLWVSRKINPQIANKQDFPRPSPVSHKDAVLKSLKIQYLLDKISVQQNVPKEQLERQVRTILDEIGYNKNLKLIRWLGLILMKICLKISTGIYVNAGVLVELKSAMGYCPVIFVPSHRSYADFILMSCVCFMYDIEIPAIAAGMDFHGMWGMGKMLRDTGAFFMRRSYNDDSLYWTTFKQYIYQLVAKGDLPIEFFIEGTRSRSNKSLSPKYGLISMVLKPFFFSEVFDILFVPINISYDRILEESLFAFELLGVPKPKESTSAFFKSLKVLKEHFGNVHFHFDKPISSREFFGDKIDKSVHSLKPLYQQEVTEEEKLLIPPLAHEIVYRQQKSSVITIFNLVALVLNNNLSTCKVLLSMPQLTEEVRWLKGVIEGFGAYVSSQDVDKSIADCFVVHKNLIQVTQHGTVCLVTNSIVLDKINPSKLKAHSLSEHTMTRSVPFIMLQIYVNPTLHYFIDAAILVSVLQYTNNLNEEELFNNYHFIRSLFSLEFITFPPREKMEFTFGFQHLLIMNIIKHTSDDQYELGSNNKLQDVLLSIIQPFLLSYFVTCYVLEGSSLISKEKMVLATIQRIFEDKVNDTTKFVHPYCLNLDSLGNCLNSLSSMGAVNKTRSNNELMLEINREVVSEIRKKIGVYIPKCHIEDSLTTNLHLQNKL